MMPIVMITDNNYAIATIVALQSLADNYKGTEILKVYIICVDLKIEYKEILKSAPFEKLEIFTIDSDWHFEEVFQKRDQYVTLTALLKFEIPNILPTYNEVLYLDGDVLVKKDISELLQIELHQCYAGVIADYDCVKDRNDNKRIGHEMYFNSGVMILNCALLRNERFPEKLLNIKRNQKELHYMDQDVFNVGFEENVLYLSPVNNFMSGYDFYTVEEINNFFSTQFLGEEDMNEKVRILHLAGVCKPWKCREGNHVKEWMEYFNRSPIKDFALNYTVRKEKKGIFTKNYISDETTTITIGTMEILRKHRYRGGAKFKFFGGKGNESV